MPCSLALVLLSLAHGAPLDVPLLLPEGLPVDARPLATPADPADLHALGALIGRPVVDPVVGRLGEHWMVDVPVHHRGIPVFRGDTRIRGLGDRAILVIGRPTAPPAGTFPLPASAAIAAVRAHTRTPSGPATARRVWAPGDPLQPAWEVALDPADAAWRALVHAESGALLAVWSEHAFLTGTATAAHHARNVDGSPLVTSPLPGVRITGPTGETFADDAGAWTLDEPLPLTLTLAGTYATVNDRNGEDLAWVSPTETIHVEGPDADLSEIDAYIHVHTIRDWGLDIWPDNSFVAEPIELDVEQGIATCNAFFLGRTLHFYRPINLCWSTAQHADVVFHEWGHGFHFHGRQAGIFDLPLSEGIADIVAWRQTGDAVIARGLFKDGSGFRDLRDVWRHPDDIDLDDPHGTGQIVSGALYDFTLINAERLGQDGAVAALDRLLPPLLAMGPEIATFYSEALAADDDDGSLANGTPNDCAITMGFGLHGYGPLADGWTVSATHPAPLPAPDVETGLRFELTATPDPCLDRAVATATVTWTLDGEPQPDLEASADGAAVQAWLPALPGGSTVTYRAEGALFDGTPWSSPDDGGTWALEIPAAPVRDTADPTPAARDREAPAGCGCNQPGLPPTWTALALLLAARRRR